jgi:hypothetical protein
METTVTYAGEISPKFNPVIGTIDAIYTSHTYDYYLDINQAGDVVGGEWISDRRPDFIWTQGPVNFIGYWAKLNEIYLPISVNND